MDQACWSWIVLGCLVLIATACSASPESAVLLDENSASYEVQAIRQGESLFASQCALCHGSIASGGFVPDAIELDADGRYVRDIVLPTVPLVDVFARLGEDGVRSIIDAGDPNTFMPAYAIEGGGSMSDQQIDKIIVYLRSEQSLGS